MKTNNIIFVAGIHGVGKTTICSKICKKSGIKHYSASELISKYKVENFKKDKKVENISKNQNILYHAVRKYLDNDKYYLLDGHFCLININGNVERIPLDIFERLPIREIVVLIDKAENIRLKLMNRDSNKYSLDFIKEFQNNEIEYAKEISKRLRVCCRCINVQEAEKELLEY